MKLPSPDGGLPPTLRQAVGEPKRVVILMSNLLQLTCPKCSANLQVQRPDAQVAVVKCNQCGKPFKFRVPARPSQSVPRTQPSASPVAQDDLFGSLPDLDGAASTGHGAASAPSVLQSPKRPIRRAGTKRRPVKGRRLTPWLVAGASLIALSGVLGVSFWYLAGRIGLAVFDSASSVLRDADQNDRDIVRLVGAIEGDKVSQETMDQLGACLRTSHRLIARAATLPPTESRVDVHEGPMDDAAIDAIQDKILDLPREKQLGLTFTLNQAIDHSMFLRDYLGEGNVDLPEPGSRGEEIAAEHIELLRRANAAGGGVLRKLAAEDLSRFVKDPESARAYVKRKYEPIHGEISQLAEEMHDLAAERYYLAEEQRGDPQKYTDHLRYANKMFSRVYAGVIGLDHGKVTTSFDSLGEFVTANKDLRRGPSSIPSRLTEKVAADREAEAKRKQQEYEQARVAAARQRAADEAERKRNEAEQAKLAAAEKQKADQQAREKGREEIDGMDAQPEQRAMERDLALGQRPVPSGRGPRFGPQGGPGDQRLGSDRFRGSRGPFAGPGGRTGGLTGRPTPPAGMRGPRGRIGGQNESAAPFDSSTGVTITMNDASSLDTGSLSRKFAHALKVPTNVRVSNGQMTIRLNYTGSLTDVVKLIDFGEVVSQDQKTRTIKVAPNQA